tara:strand:- start:578 stop:790 length:213 start_codon:yes stop_codon:yes gene_type:complete
MILKPFRLKEYDVSGDWGMGAGGTVNNKLKIIAFGSAVIKRRKEVWDREVDLGNIPFSHDIYTKPIPPLP